uniref:PDZ and LIM domain protein 5 isoform X1 n=1 Tax=Podarcis muralis TaxID=64176 RepID=UPI00109F639E|nr:PDZ and LIM domain protein 5 isoform X1 [Podarcis muralis]XP_028599344.1 PDZ and LIM domain protein 5 isoform X1 [Podarcis muralis]XP_028599346.1 PDZ and LIM domain protein 5 isoform X1 [Podarcis muralis]XP_028599347.1 PDZ and LIM domain protein 5 isoform X1 [Podarcis muralis]XP_028599348.1 PDZ and LIM domain protein 5 isoform X1 [Podarcis muralis]
MNNYSVSLVGPAPWGFRLQGGKDFNMPLTISRLSDGGKAANANVGIGDVVLSIDGISADGMTHLEAQNKIKTCSGKLTMNLQRAPSAPKPDPIPVQQVEPKELVKPVPIPSAVVPKVSSTANIAFNKAPRPFGSMSASKITSIPSPSSAFTPAHASFSSHASPTPLANVTPPTAFTASGLHANAKSNADQRSPELSAAKPAVNTPWQPTHNASLNTSFNDNAQEVAEGQRRGFRENQGDSKEQNGPPRKHVVYTNTEFYHPPTHSNNSKKRLIEDTEDWHPRTGTTQSRSFRILAQITGTEHMKEPEPDNSKKANDSQEQTQFTAYTAATVRSMPETPENGTRGPVPANPASVPAVKPTGPQYAVKTSSWQSSNQPAAGSGWASDKSGRPGATVPSEKSPAAPPLPTDEDTLVQMAEHIPAGKRTPMCAHCNQVIRGPFLVALGKSWHPEEFNCAHCKTSMAYIGFVEEKGALYCEGCYEKFLAPECARCQRKILGEVINALKQTWHVSCFVCVACHKPIRNNVFHLEDGDPYCETDYYGLFGTMCHGCEFPIEAGDRFLEALGHTWHDTCFVCSVCCESLEGHTFFSKKDKPLCKKHAHSVNI